MREISRSSRATCSRSSAICASSSVIFAFLSSSSARSDSFSARSPATVTRRAAASSGTPDVSGTRRSHQSLPYVSNATRSAGQKPAPITPCQPANQPTPSASRGDLNVYPLPC